MREKRLIDIYILEILNEYSSEKQKMLQKDILSILRKIFTSSYSNSEIKLYSGIIWILQNMITKCKKGNY